MSGVSLNYLQPHIDHYYWQLYHQGNPDIFLAMLEDIQIVNNQ